MDATQLRKRGLEVLEELGRRPAAPYYEHAVAGYVRGFCERAGLRVEADLYGNLLVTVPGSDGAAPGIAFVAHLDHPGFEVVAREREGLAARALGGVPAAALEAGSRVQVLARTGERVPGRVARRVGAVEDRAVLIEVDGSGMGALPCAVVLDLPDFELDGETIHMRALDDLAGCAAILVALREVVPEPPAGTVYGLFTRAEEAGLIGARLAAEDGVLQRDTTIVSLEASRALPGAEIGCGPVIRTGDRMTTFDHSAEAYLLAARDRLAGRPDGFKCQRQLMSGGACEASAFAAFGYSVTGVAFPLGNYHNNGPDETVASEFVHVSDFVGGTRLLVEAASLAGSAPVAAAAARLRERPEEGAGRLAGGR